MAQSIDSDYSVTVETSREARGRRHYICIRRSGTSIQLPVSFTNKRKAEWIARFLYKHLKPEFQRELVERQEFLRTSTRRRKR